MNEIEIQELIQFSVQSNFGTKCTVIKKQTQSWYFRFVINTPEKINKFISPLYQSTFGTIECTWHFTAFNCHLLDNNVEKFVEYYQAEKEGREI